MNDLKQKKRIIFQQKISKFLKNQNKNRLSQSVIDHLKFFPWPENCKIALYYPLHQEVNVRLMSHLHPHISWLYPCRHNFKFALCRSDTVFEKSEKGFFQPVSDIYFPIEDIDVFIVPALAFDREFRRLGRGGGFYDKALSRSKKSAVKIGIAWSVQIDNESLPFEETDISMDAVVTENWMAYSKNFFNKYENWH